MRSLVSRRVVLNVVLAWILLVSTANAQPSPPVIIRVDSQSQTNGPGNLENWSNAFDNWEDAMEEAAIQVAAAENVEVWLAAVPGPPSPLPPNWNYGNFDAYIPAGSSRSDTFYIGSDLDGVRIYGGFLGLSHPTAPETSISQRDPYNHRTILAGHLEYGVTGMKYHVVTFEDVGAATIFDGFYIVHSRATGSGTDEDVGGGILIRDANPTIAKCLFNHNKADSKGAGIYIKSASGPVRIFNCSFVDNGTDAFAHGGDIYNEGEEVHLTNCRFHGSKVHLGGSIYNNNGAMTITNCTFACSTAVAKTHEPNPTEPGEGGAIYSTGNNLIVTNSIFWEGIIAQNSSQPIWAQQIYVPSGQGSATVTYCCIDDGSPGGDIPFGGAANHNIDLNPLFVAPDPPDPDPPPAPQRYCGSPHADFRLKVDSPCIGTGNCSAVPADLADLDNDSNTSEPVPWDLGEIGDNDRFIQSIDMGAYERPLCAGDASFNGKVDIDDLLIVIHAWGTCSTPPCPGDLTPTANNVCGDGEVDIDDLLTVITDWGCGIPDPDPPPQGILDCIEDYGDDIEKLEACIEAMIRAGTP